MIINGTATYGSDYSFSKGDRFSGGDPFSLNEVTKSWNTGNTVCYKVDIYLKVLGSVGSLDNGKSATVYVDAYDPTTESWVNLASCNSGSINEGDIIEKPTTNINPTQWKTYTQYKMYGSSPSLEGHAECYCRIYCYTE